LELGETVPIEPGGGKGAGGGGGGGGGESGAYYRERNRKKGRTRNLIGRGYGGGDTDCLGHCRRCKGGKGSVFALSRGGRRRGGKATQGE